MEAKTTKKVAAVVMTFIMLVTYFPFALNASAAEAGAKTGFTDELLGKYIIDENFSGTEESSLPAGWDKTYQYANINADSGNATGLTGDTISVKSDGGNKYLQNNSSGGDHILTLPALGTENYELTAELEYSDYTAPEKDEPEEPSGITYTFDENDREYVTIGTKYDDYYTTVNSETVSRDGAAVYEYSEGNNAMRITALATRMNTFPAQFSIADNNNGYADFNPKLNTKYKISFKYIVKKACSDAINIELRWEKNGNRYINYFDNSNYIADTLLTIPAGSTQGEWQTFEKEITINTKPEDATDVFIALSDGKSWVGGEWYRSEIEMWIDDIAVTPVVLQTVTNTYDEEGLPENFTKWEAAVEEYESGNNAVKVTELVTRSYAWPACFRILDSNNGYTEYVPQGNTKYKISFKYRVNKANANNKPIAIELRWDKPNGDMSMSYDNLVNYGYLIDTLVTSAAGETNGEWVSFEKEVNLPAAPDNSNSIYIAVTTGLNDWQGKEGDIELWIDDVTVTQIKEDFNGGFGIVTDIANDYTKETGFTRFKLEPPTENDKAKIVVEQCSADSSKITEERYFAYGEEVNSFFGGTEPAPNTKIILTAVHHNGTTTFYCNGIYVYEIADVNDEIDLNDRVGIYNCGGELKITSVKIREIGQIFEGDTLINQNFNSISAGEIPEDWDKTAPYKTTLFEDANISSGPEDTYVYEEGYLRHRAMGGTHILTLPELGTEDYVISAVVRYNTSSAAFGLITDVPENYAAAEKATVSAIDPRSESACITVGNRIADENGGYDANSVKLTGDSFKACFGGNMPSANSDIILTAYHYQDITYFFLNGVFTAKAADGNTVPGSRVGFYSCGGDVNIYSVTVKEIFDASEITAYTQDFETIIHHDFKSEETPSVPGDWITVNTGWTWLGKNVEVSAYDGEAGKGVLLDSTVNGGGTGALILPKLGTVNYCMTAEIKLLTDYGTFGLLNNITDPAVNSNSAVHMVANINSNVVSIYDRSGGDYRGLRDFGVNTVFKDKSDGYDTYTLTAYSYNGRSYYFIDGEYIGSINQVNPETNESLCGFYTYNSKMLISSVTVNEVIGELIIGGAMDITGVSVRYADISGNSNDFTSAGVRFNASVDKNSPIYKMNSDPTYEYTENGQIEFGMVFELTERLDGKYLTAMTPGAAVVPAKESYTQTDDALNISAELIGMPPEFADKNITVRGYILLRKDGKDIYYYTDTYEYCIAQVANKFYEDTESEDIKERLDKVFADSELYLGKHIETFTFTLFSDLHYKENMYISSVEDVNTIVERAKATDSELMLQLGDFCNDFIGSPEITNAYLNNKYGIPAYGVYGNHELESTGNSMSAVTPLITNRINDVVWGTADGKIGDGSIAYYYFEVGDYRFVCTDTNYSYNPKTSEWQHNQTNSYGPPDGNTNINALGPVQLEWLEAVLTEAANSGKHCIVSGHATFHEVWPDSSADAEAVRAIYSKVNKIKKGTVIMSLNGHSHSNHIGFTDNILYFDVNTVRNGWWQGNTFQHYTPEHTFEFISYDESGNPVEIIHDRPISELWQASQTWFFEEPLSATVTISSTGKITVEGVSTKWIYDVTPDNVPNYVVPKISSEQVEIWY